MIKLSIIIPHYNTPLLLQKLLETIPNIPEIEVLVIDDTSTKEKEQYQECMENNRLRNVTFYANSMQTKGAGNARNIGLVYAQGEWILFADADDYFTEEFWEITVLYLQDSADVIYFAPASIMLKTGKSSERHTYYKELVQKFSHMPTIENKLKIRYAYWSPCSKLIRHELIKKHNIKFDGTLHSNDMMFSTKTGHYAKEVKAVEKTIYMITQSEKSLTTSKEEKDLKERTDVFCNYYFFLHKVLKRWEMKLLGYGSKDYIYFVLYRMNIISFINRFLKKRK